MGINSVFPAKHFCQRHTAEKKIFFFFFLLPRLNINSGCLNIAGHRTFIVAGLSLLFKVACVKLCLKVPLSAPIVVGNCLLFWLLNDVKQEYLITLS